MAEASLSHLNYGHPGMATYDLERREWSFARSNAKTTFKQIHQQKDGPDISTQVLSPSRPIDNLTASTRRTDTAASIKVSTQQYPEINPAAALLPELAITSTSIISATATYDPLISDLFTVGHIPIETKTTSRRIAAAVTGPCGNILRLMFFYAESQGWVDDRTIALRGETLKDAESGLWNRNAAPIQQVCFAQSSDRISFLAVRLPTRTIILRPDFSTHLRPSDWSSWDAFPPSRIHPHPVISVDIGQTGGNAHVDVTFNPDYQYQFALVDEGQNWSMWDIVHSRKSGTYEVSCLVQGMISEEPSNIGEDKWARILWVGDVSTILVCSRRHLGLVSVGGDMFTRLPCPPVISPRSSDWILDVKRHPSARNCFFVLTSTTLFLVGVSTLADAQDAASDVIGGRIILAWPHYRGTEDITLSMYAQTLARIESDAAKASEQLGEDATAEVTVLVQSRLNDLIHCYRFDGNPSGASMTAFSSPPKLLELSVGGAGYITNMRLELLPYHENGKSDDSTPGHIFLREGVNFYKLFVARSDLSIHEALLSTSPSSINITAIEPPTWSTVNRGGNMMRMASAYEMDDFVVLDGLDTQNFSPLQEVPEIVESKKSSFRADQIGMYHDISTGDVGVDAKTTDIMAVAHRLSTILRREQDSAQAPLGTLLEYAGMKIDVRDVDESSDAFINAFSSGSTDSDFELRHVSHSALFLGVAGGSSIAHLYDALLQHWVAPLPQDVSIRARQVKERLARRIAAELMLASTCVRQRDKLEPNFVIESRSGDHPLPMRSSQPVESSQIGPSHFSLQALPTLPLLASQPSSQPSSSQSMAGHRQESASPTTSRPLERLSRHLRFRDDNVEDVQIKANVSQLLAHWQPGSDPHAYNWEATENVIYDDNLDEASQEQKEKKRRRKARRERKQQRENELMRSQPASQTFTFAKPVPLPRSSPGPMIDTMTNSSQMPIHTYSQVPLPGTSGGFGGVDAFVAQSQVEPGRFGGRPDKKKKKKRMGGF